MCFDMVKTIKISLYFRIIHKELQKIPEITAAVVDPRTLSPLGRSRAKKNVGSSTKEVSKQEPDKVSDVQMCIQ